MKNNNPQCQGTDPDDLPACTLPLINAEDTNKITALLASTNPDSVNLGIDMAHNFAPQQCFLFGQGKCQKISFVSIQPQNKDNEPPQPWIAEFEYVIRPSLDKNLDDHEKLIQLLDIGWAEVYTNWDNPNADVRSCNRFNYQVITSKWILDLISAEVTSKVMAYDNLIAIKFKAVVYHMKGF